MTISKEPWYREADSKEGDPNEPLYEKIQRLRQKSRGQKSQYEELESEIEKALDKAEDVSSAPYERDNVRKDLMRLRKLKDTYPTLALILGDPDFKRLEEIYL